MEPDSYSTIEVIEALQSVGVAEEVIEKNERKKSKSKNSKKQ